MKVSYLWLKEFVDFDLAPEELGSLFRKLGFELVSVTRFGGDVKNVVAAKVQSARKHPNADKLSLCKVFDGKETLDIVCGAPNVAAGMTVPLARVGAVLPGGQKIEKAVIRGESSSGMLCSVRELGLGTEHAGILALPGDVPAGQDIVQTLSLDDAVLDVEVTPNRGDALSHWGLAREIAAALRKKVRLPDAKLPKAKPSASLVKVSDAGCSRYVGRVIEGVQVKPSPLRMKLRLERCGIRSISNVVDVTNYVLLELGHPLHAFDRAKLAEGRVVVRRGKDGEKLACLDDVERPVAGALVIADAQAPAALAGVIGGRPSSVTDSTRDLLVESAVFEPALVRRTRMALNVSTESSYRFERGTDWTLCRLAADRAAKLILEVAGGTLAAEQDAQRKKPAAVKVSVRPERVNALLGTSVPAAEMKKSLESLGFAVKAGKGGFAVTPPMHRLDVREEPDVAEEIGRLVGYDRIPARFRTAAQAPEPQTRERGLVLSARSFFTGLGFYEARNYGLVSRKLREQLHGAAAGAGAVELENPISLSGELLAPDLATHLLVNVQTNARHGTRNVRLFETARTFADGGKGVRESLTLGWIAAGQTHGEHWKHKPRGLEIWDAKAWMKALLRDWRLAGARFDAAGAPAFLHPSESLSVFLGGEAVGWFGRLHPRQAAAWDAPADTFLGQLDLTALSAGKFLDARFRPLPKHPAVLRDFSLSFPESVSWSAVAHKLFGLHEAVADVRLFDVFKDVSLAEGHRSLAFSVAFRHPDRTMTDAEAGEIQKKVLSELESAFGARARAAAAKPGPVGE